MSDDELSPEALEVKHRAELRISLTQEIAKDRIAHTPVDETIPVDRVIQESSHIAHALTQEIISIKEEATAEMQRLADEDGFASHKPSRRFNS